MSGPVTGNPNETLIIETIHRAGSLLREAAQMALGDMPDATPEEYAELAGMWVTRAIAPCITVQEFQRVMDKAK
jgi:hypothetical protein